MTAKKTANWIKKAKVVKAKAKKPGRYNYSKTA